MTAIAAKPRDFVVCSAAKRASPFPGADFVPTALVRASRVIFANAAPAGCEKNWFERNQLARHAFYGPYDCDLMTVNRAEKNKTPDTSSPDPKAVEAIGRALTAHYVDLVQAPLPDKFAELLARLERADKAPAPQGRGDAID